MDNLKEFKYHYGIAALFGLIFGAIAAFSPVEGIDPLNAWIVLGIFFSPIFGLIAGLMDGSPSGGACPARGYAGPEEDTDSWSLYLGRWIWYGFFYMSISIWLFRGLFSLILL